MNLASLGGWPGVTAAAAATAGVVATGGYFAGVFDKTEPTVPQEPAALIQPAPEATPKAAPAVAVAEPKVIEPVPAPVPESAAEPVALPAPPRFDIVRVEPDGSTLVAGSAAPAWPVAVMLDGSEMIRETAGQDGKFVTFLDLPSSQVPRVMTLVMYGPNGEGEITSQDEVILGPTVAPTPKVAATDPVAEPAAEPAAPAETPAPAKPEVVAAADPAMVDVKPLAPRAEPADAKVEPATTAVADPVIAAVEPKPMPAEDPAAEPAADPSTARTETIAAPKPEPAEPAAQDPVVPTVILSGKDGVRVLQAKAPDVMDNVALDSISYSDAGEVQLSGRGTQGGFVRIYLDDTPITVSRIAEDGSWRSDLPEVDTKVYQLRVDQVTDTGNVTSRVETPFKPAAPADAVAAQQGPVRQVTVQPGSTLWAIARDRYGEGQMYLRVFDANRELIRDPDLIYPGQVFTVPVSD